MADDYQGMARRPHPPRAGSENVLGVDEEANRAFGTHASAIKRAYRRRESESMRALYSWKRPDVILRSNSFDRNLAMLLSLYLEKDYSELQVFEVGCGEGGVLLGLLRWGVRAESMAGCDLIESRISEAAKRLPNTVKLYVGDASMLPEESASYDLVIQSTVLSSVLDSNVRREICKEMLRIVRPGGLIVSYDFCFDNPSNNDVRRVRLKELEGYFNATAAQTRRLTLAPPLARSLQSQSRVAQLMEWLPFLCTHQIAVFKKQLPR